MCIKFTLFFSLLQGRRPGLIGGAKKPGQSKLMKGIDSMYIIINAWPGLSSQCRFLVGLIEVFF